MLMWQFLLTWHAYVLIFAYMTCLHGKFLLLWCATSGKNYFPPPRQLLTVKVGQTKQCYLYCTNIYSSVPELSRKYLLPLRAPDVIVWTHFFTFTHRHSHYQAITSMAKLLFIPKRLLRFIKLEFNSRAMIEKHTLELGWYFSRNDCT